MTEYRSRHFKSIAHKREFKRDLRADRIRMLRRDLLRWGGALLASASVCPPGAAQILQFSGAGGGGGGGGYSDIDWPSAANRPTVSGQTMTWVGPVGGGANNGNPQLQTINLTSSSITGSSANGQVIQGLDITLNNNTSFIVNHSNVTIRNCRIRGGGWNFLEMDNATVIEDCELSGLGGRLYEGVIAGSNSVIRRCNIHDFENFISNGGTVCEISDNWMHSAQGPDCDMVELYGGTDQYTIRRNSFDYPVASGYLNSGVNLTNWNGPVTNCLVDSNYFISPSGALFCICDDSGQGGGAFSWGAQNNAFYNNTLNYRRGGTTCAPNTGNFNTAVYNSHSGSPTNGTGAI